jgi:hypothetical protein
VRIPTEEGLEITILIGEEYPTACAGAGIIVTPMLDLKSLRSGVQHALGRSAWRADAVPEDLRSYIVEHWGDSDAVLVVDEASSVKEGAKSVGVARQSSTDEPFSIVNCTFRGSGPPMRHDAQRQGSGRDSLCHQARARAIMCRTSSGWRCAMHMAHGEYCLWP